MSDTLILHSSARPGSYPVDKAHYHHDANQCLWLSVECAASREDPELPGFCFCLLRYPLEGEPAAGTIIWLPYAQGERSSFEQSSSHAYDGVHYDPWSLRVDILGVQPGTLHLAGTFLLEGEITLHGFRPCKEHVSFDAHFRSATIEEIWNPGY